jgi:isopropylmalate/homocitrate/citramalate synthase
MDTKMELIRRLAKTGVTTIEAGSFVPAKWVPQVWALSASRRSDLIDVKY